MGTPGKTQFSWPIWLSVTAIAGFVALMLTVGLAETVPLMRLVASALERAAGLLVLSILLSLPTLAQQELLRRFGVDAPRFYLATVLGGWIMLVGAIEGALLMDEIGFDLILLGIDAEIVVLLGGLALGCTGIAVLQSLALPRVGRRFYLLFAVPGAIVGLAVALSLVIATLLLTLDYPMHEYPMLDILLAAASFGIGWACYAAATGWPIRRAIERKKPHAAPPNGPASVAKTPSL